MQILRGLVSSRLKVNLVEKKPPNIYKYLSNPRDGRRSVRHSHLPCRFKPWFYSFIHTLLSPKGQAKAYASPEATRRARHGKSLVSEAETDGSLEARQPASLVYMVTF